MMNQRVKDLLKKYKYDFIYCESCGGRVIRDKELVCSVCGLVQDKILKNPTEKDNPYRNSNESKYHKYKREANHDKKINKLDREKNRFTNVRILKETNKKLSRYCKENHLTKYKFLTEIIEDKILEGDHDE